MKQTKTVPKLLSILLLTFFASIAQATIWNIDAVLNGDGVSGYGASSFHRASDGSAMSGTNLGNLTTSTGFFGT